jgi:ABC-type polysaccharide/polyol phosphate export permease
MTAAAHTVPAVHTTPAPDAIGPSSRARKTAGLAWVLSRKNFKVRYKRATLGVIWAVVQPAFQAAFLSFIFLKVFKIQGIPDYPLFVLSGMLPWAYFTSGVIAATTAVVDNAPLVRKVAVAKAVFPLSAVGGVAIAFAVSVPVLLVLSASTGHIGFAILLLVPAFLLETAVTAALGVLACSFHVAFRDVRYAVESLLLVGLYASPVLYDIGRVPAKVRPFFRLNPMAGVMSLYRCAVLGNTLDVAAVVTAVIVMVALTGLAVLFFARRSDEFPDIV